MLTMTMNFTTPNTAMYAFVLGNAVAPQVACDVINALKEAA